jgi:hypothetical protein
MAEQEKLRCKVTDTKQAILKAYKTHLDDINVKQQGALNTEKIQTEKKKTETLQRVETVAKLDVPSTIVSLTTNINQTLTGILNSLAERRAQLADVETAIQIKKDELNELYGIEKSASSIAALIESHKTLQSELSEEYNEKQTELEEALDAAKKHYESSRKQWSDELVQLKKDEDLARKREKEEYLYTFERDKAQRMNALNDEIAKKNLVLIEREKIVAEREKKVKDLEELVVTLEAKIVSESERVRKETEEKCKASAETAARFAKMSHDNALGTVNGQLLAANDRIKDLIASNSKLQAALESANAKVQEIAAEALKSGANAKTIAEVRSMFDMSSRSGK